VATADLAGLTWSPCGRFIAVYDSILTVSCSFSSSAYMQYALHIYSPLGPLVHSFSPASPSFSLLSASEDPGLGVRCATWAPNGRWIALGGWDGKVRVVESEGGRCVASMSWMARTVERDTVSQSFIGLLTLRPSGGNPVNG
jgi:WD40 repeat protein